MIYDTTYALVQLLETFLRNHPEVLDACCRADRFDEVASVADGSSLLISRFEKWLERDGGRIDSTYRTALQNLIETRVELAATYETAKSLTHA
jgi:hypothetical protein